MKLAEYQALAQNPNVRMFLDLVEKTEGVKHGYNTLFGNEKFASLADHPRVRKTFKQTDGKKNVTTAAGRYQFLESTWDDVAKKLGLRDFSAANQDIAAIELMRRNGSLAAVLKGDFDTAVQKSGVTWASLPSSPYPQGKKSTKFVNDTLAKLGRTGPSIAAAVEAIETPAAPVSPVQAVAAGISETAGPPAPSLAPPAWAAQVAAAAPPRETAPVQFDTEGSEIPWEDRLMQYAVDQQVNDEQANALAAFFGDATPAPQLALPASIDDSINRYLAKL